LQILTSVTVGIHSEFELVLVTIRPKGSAWKCGCQLHTNENISTISEEFKNSPLWIYRPNRMDRGHHWRIEEHVLASHQTTASSNRCCKPQKIN